MKKLLKFILLVITLGGCHASFQQPVLDDKSQLALPEKKPVGEPVLHYNEGILDNFSYTSTRWTTWSDKLIMNWKGGMLTIESVGAGPEYASLSYKFPTLDFSGNEIIKIKAKTEGKEMPLMRVILKDAFGKEVNALASSYKLTTDWNEYYFSYKNHWKQSWPDTATVDSTRITEMLIYLNPGGPEFNGKVVLDEVKAVPFSEAKLPESTTSAPVAEQRAKPASILYAYGDGVENWWGDKKIQVVSKDSVMVLVADSVGPKYEVFGTTIKPTDFRSTGLIRIMAKVQGAESPLLTISLTDKAGHGTNMNPAIEKISNKGGYKNYFFNFKERYMQAWPDTVRVNPAEIVSVIGFINAGKNPFTGKLYIWEVEVMSEEAAAKLRNNVQQRVEVDKEE